MGYFEKLKTDYRHEYLTSTPTKSGALANANKKGIVKILPNSNNRAVTIETETSIFLQSYDTTILEVKKETSEIIKRWDGYSVTTLKHINEFLSGYGLKFSKKEWLNFEGVKKC